MCTIQMFVVRIVTDHQIINVDPVSLIILGFNNKSGVDMANQPIKVLIVDDHAIVRKGIKALLNEFDDIVVVGEAENGLVAIELLNRLKPDAILIDLLMPVMDGIEAIKRM